VLAAVKAWPGNIGAARTDLATASLDRGSTRGQCQTAGRDEETGFKVDQRNKTVRKGISVTPLQTVPAVVPLSSGRRSQKRTTDVLPKPDNSKSYRHWL
jgi:hypothetical protein